MIKLRVKQSVENKGISSRAAVIQSSEIGDIETPQPIFSNSESNKLLELNKSKFLPSRFIPKNKVIEISREFTSDKIRFLNKNDKIFDKYKKELIRKASPFNDKIKLFRPEVNKKTKIDDKANAFFTELGVQGDFDWIVIPEESYNSSPDSFIKRIINTREQIYSDIINERTKDMIPTLWTGGKENIFKKKVDAVIDNGFKVIGINYESTIANRSNYYYLKKVAQDKDLITMLFNCEKTFRSNYTTAMNHFMTLFNFDFISLKGKVVIDPNVKLKTNYGPRILDKSTLGYLKISDYISRYRNTPIGSTILDSGLDLTKFIEKYNTVDLLSEAIKLHNSTTSFSEFSIERREIIDKNLDGYIKNKEYLLKAVDKVFQYNSNRIV
jgi:hypothetical protein